jgi:ABC-type antimicrobial peptide transport system permease subunit
LRRKKKFLVWFLEIYDFGFHGFAVGFAVGVVIGLGLSACRFFSFAAAGGFSLSFFRCRLAAKFFRRVRQRRKKKFLI